MRRPRRLSLGGVLIALLTTSRKATVGAVIAALYPLYALLQSEVEIGWRDGLTCLVGGLIGFLGVWAPPNTEPYEPRHAAAPPED